MRAIKTEKLTKVYGDKTVVDGIDFDVNEGELVSLLGVNGAGKTTTIKMLSCLTHITSGEAYMKGYSVKDEPSKVKNIINVSPQETAVAPKLTVRENLELISEIYGLKREKVKLCCDRIIKELSLSEVESKKAKLLSGGYQRKLSIAMALITEPEILFLDEPTLGLDVKARRSLWKQISSLKGKTTVILTTHYLEEAQALADRIGIMDKGTLRIVDTPDNIIKSTGKDNLEDAFLFLTDTEDEEE